MTTKNTAHTPLMRQYLQIKARHPDMLMLYRMGDFYETFFDDAKTISKLLGIALTKRANGKAADVPLAGFPYHAIDAYLPRLIKAGHRVAVCEQVEDPKQAKGIVKRDVIEIVTPGTTLSDKVLEQKNNNYLATVCLGENSAGISLVDISTGEFSVSEVPLHDLAEQVRTLLPAEIVVSHAQFEAVSNLLKPVRHSFVFTKQEEWHFTFDFAHELLINHFKTHSLKGFGCDHLTVGIQAAGAALHYVRETQRAEGRHICRLVRHETGANLVLDSVTMRNLEILTTIQDNRKHGSLISILDRTRTAPGARMMRKWITRPLARLTEVQMRLNCVDELFNDTALREALSSLFAEANDLERLVARISTGRANAREVVGLNQTLKLLPELKQRLGKANSERLNELAQKIQLLETLIADIDRAIADDPPASLKDGRMIRNGFNAELDDLRAIASSGRTWISEFQKSERTRTGISSLKVSFNKVFGYYIEITHVHKDKVPESYIRKQTLVNSERFITPELKNYEEKVLTAQDRIVEIEFELFDAVRRRIAEHTAAIQDNAAVIAEADCYTAFAEVSLENRYCKPKVHDGNTLKIRDGRHAVIEKILPLGEAYIPNDLDIDPGQSQIHIITGPNMAGKSSYLRQVGLIVLMAQIGCFVPAREAEIGLVDKIFTRVGASDNLAEGESTFLVEMNETANIINNATARSLVLLDEIGRGTSTFDGLAIAWAVTEYLHERIGAKTLFATHYHELNELEHLLERVTNYNVVVKEQGDRMVFTRKVKRGGCDHSYGIEVAKLAGLPAEMIHRAKEVMYNLESHEISAHQEKKEKGSVTVQKIGSKTTVNNQVQLFNVENPVNQKLREMLDSLNPDELTPIEALNKLHELSQILKSQGK